MREELLGVVPWSTAGGVASDISLANVDWGSEPAIVSIDRFAGKLKLLSLLFGAITIDELEIEIAAKASYSDLATLGGAKIELDLDGPDVAEFTELFGLSTLGDGPFRIQARADPRGREPSLVRCKRLARLRLADRRGPPFGPHA